jgi:hypothetical protein
MSAPDATKTHISAVLISWICVSTTSKSPLRQKTTCSFSNGESQRLRLFEASRAVSISTIMMPSAATITVLDDRRTSGSMIERPIQMPAPMA